MALSLGEILNRGKFCLCGLVVSLRERLRGGIVALTRKAWNGIHMTEFIVLANHLFGLYNPVRLAYTTTTCMTSL